MFNNIGSKIKKLTTFVAVFLMIIFTIIGAIYMYRFSDEWYIGLLIIIIGSLFSWLGSFVLYGFGELVENSAIIAGKQELNQPQITENKHENNEEQLDNNIPKKNECPICFHKIKKTDKECEYCGHTLK